MADVNDVLTCLTEYADTEGYDEKQLQPHCERGLLWVEANLKPGADKESPLIAPTAAAVAHYYFFMARLTETDRYQAFQAGDMTVRRDIEKEMKFEARIKDEAIAAASSVLKDGGFFFSGS